MVIDVSDKVSFVRSNTFSKVCSNTLSFAPFHLLNKSLTGGTSSG